MLTTAQWIFVLYLAFIFLIGVVAAYFTQKTPSDFYIADRRVGSIVLGLSLVATVLSAFTVFGIGAVASGTGIGVFSFLGIAAILYPLIFGTVGVTLYVVGLATQTVTPSEYIRNRYESPAAAVIYLAVTGIFGTAMVVGQLIGGGVALDTLLGIPYWQAVLYMAGFMLVYIHIAGYRGVIWSDSIQAGVLFVVLVGIFIYVLFGMDPNAIAVDAMEVTDGLFEMVGPIGIWTPLVVITAAIAFMFGVTAYPHCIQRYFSANSAKTMVDSGFIYPIVSVPAYFTAVMLGAWALGVIPSPENPDYIIPFMVEAVTNPVVFGILMAGATAAIMSTADSVLLTFSSMVSRDVWVEFVEPDAGEYREVLVTQVALVLGIITAVIFALVEPPGIFAVVEFAVVGFSATSAPVFLGAFWKRATTAGTVASLILGPGITFLFFLEVIPPEFTFGMHYGFVGVLIHYLVFVGVSLMSPAPSEEAIRENSRSFWDPSGEIDVEEEHLEA